MSYIDSDELLAGPVFIWTLVHKVNDSFLSC